MPDTGAPWNIPYVASSDLVKDWPTDSQTLAEAIADGLDAAGKIAQVVQSVKTDASSNNSSTLTAVAGLSVSITPETATNKVLIIASFQVSGSGGAQRFNLRRDSTNIFQSTGGGTANQTYGRYYGNSNTISDSLTIVYLDSPATTSATTYDITMATTAGEVFVGRPAVDGNYPSASTITAIEVKA